jgi:hypothetical protein
VHGDRFRLGHDRVVRRLTSSMQILTLASFHSDIMCIIGATWQACSDALEHTASGHQPSSGSSLLRWQLRSGIDLDGTVSESTAAMSPAQCRDVTA